MFHPAKFPGGSAGIQRRDLLREIQKLFADMTADEPALSFRRWEQRDRRGMYVIDFGLGEFGLEKSQVELFTLGVLAALRAARAPTSPQRLTELIDQLRVLLPAGVYPVPWKHEAQPDAPPPPPADDGNQARPLSARRKSRKG